MKVGIGTNLLDKKGYGRWGEGMYKVLREHGFECTDYSMSDTESFLYTLPEDEAVSFLKKEKALAEDAGIKIWQVHGPWKWPLSDSTVEQRAERMDKMKKSIRMAAALECKFWVVHPIMPFGIHDKNTPEAAETWRLNLEFMTALLQTAKEYGVTICLENMPMPEFSIATPGEILDFVNEINDENFKICLDTGHVGVYDELKLSDEVIKLGNKIKVLHVHDTKANKDLHLFPHQGITDWSDFSVSLKEIGFDGVFSLETKPPSGLSDRLFEAMSRLYFEIAKEIV